MPSVSVNRSLSSVRDVISAFVMSDIGPRLATFASGLVLVFLALLAQATRHVLGDVLGSILRDAVGREVTTCRRDCSNSSSRASSRRLLLASLKSQEWRSSSISEFDRGAIYSKMSRCTQMGLRHFPVRWIYWIGSILARSNSMRATEHGPLEGFQSVDLIFGLA
jgi:hypothetical protein